MPQRTNYYIPTSYGRTYTEKPPERPENKKGEYGIHLEETGLRKKRDSNANKSKELSAKKESRNSNKIRAIYQGELKRIEQAKATLECLEAIGTNSEKLIREIHPEIDFHALRTINNHQKEILKIIASEGINPTEIKQAKNKLNKIYEFLEAPLPDHKQAIRDALEKRLLYSQDPASEEANKFNHLIPATNKEKFEFGVKDDEIKKELQNFYEFIGLSPGEAFIQTVKDLKTDLDQINNSEPKKPNDQETKKIRYDQNAPANITAPKTNVFREAIQRQLDILTTISEKIEVPSDFEINPEKSKVAKILEAIEIREAAKEELYEILEKKKTSPHLAHMERFQETFSEHNIKKLTLKAFPPRSEEEIIEAQKDLQKKNKEIDKLTIVIEKLKSEKDTEKLEEIENKLEKLKQEQELLAIKANSIVIPPNIDSIAQTYFYESPITRIGIFNKRENTSRNDKKDTELHPGIILEKLYLGTDLKNLIDKINIIESETTKNYKIDQELDAWIDDKPINFKYIPVPKNEDVVQLRIKHRPENLTWQFHFEFNKEKSNPLKELKGLKIYEINQGRPKKLIAQVDHKHEEKIWFDRKDSRHNNLHQSGQGFTQGKFTQEHISQLYKNIKRFVFEQEQSNDAKAVKPEVKKPPEKKDAFVLPSSISNSLFEAISIDKTELKQLINLNKDIQTIMDKKEKKGGQLKVNDNNTLNALIKKAKNKINEFGFFIEKDTQNNSYIISNQHPSLSQDSQNRFRYSLKVNNKNTPNLIEIKDLIRNKKYQISSNDTLIHQVNKNGDYLLFKNTDTKPKDATEKLGSLFLDEFFPNNKSKSIEVLSSLSKIVLSDIQRQGRKLQKRYEDYNAVENSIPEASYNGQNPRSIHQILARDF